MSKLSPGDFIKKEWFTFADDLPKLRPKQKMIVEKVWDGHIMKFVYGRKHTYIMLEKGAEE